MPNCAGQIVHEGESQCARSKPSVFTYMWGLSKHSETTFLYVEVLRSSYAVVSVIASLLD